MGLKSSMRLSPKYTMMIEGIPRLCTSNELHHVSAHIINTSHPHTPGLNKMHTLTLTYAVLLSALVKRSATLSFMPTFSNTTSPSVTCCLNMLFNEYLADVNVLGPLVVAFGDGQVDAILVVLVEDHEPWDRMS